MILILDFGSQTCHLIGRRLKEVGIRVKIIDPKVSFDKIKKLNPAGIILSGGPASVYKKGAPLLDKKIFNLRIPILGICYGYQLIAYLLGGRVKRGKTREYGPATLVINQPCKILTSLSPHSRVWMSHGDEVEKPPPGFLFVAQTKTTKGAVMADKRRKIFGLQFHPEAEHTEGGRLILENFAKKICGLKTQKREISIKKIIKKIKEKVGKDKVVGAVSGGTESTIAAILTIKAIGKNFLPVYVESLLMRRGTREFVKKIFTRFGVEPRIIEANEIFLEKLKGIKDPEKKRVVIGNLYYRLIKKEAEKIKGIKFFLQGTVYSDVIESRGSKKADKIKSHHNVLGLPAGLKLELLEPLREFYTDEVRQIGKKLGLSRKVVFRQPFPGPGLALRIVGEVTPARVAIIRKVTAIVNKEITREKYKGMYQAFPVLLKDKATGVTKEGVVKGKRIFGNIISIRAVDSEDAVRASVTKIPFEVLQRIQKRMTTEIPSVVKVVFDITPKPPSTIEYI